MWKIIKEAICQQTNAQNVQTLLCDDANCNDKNHNSLQKRVVHVLSGPHLDLLFRRKSNIKN